jgi:hypothetical protein
MRKIYVIFKSNFIDYKTGTAVKRKELKKISMFKLDFDGTPNE